MEPGAAGGHRAGGAQHNLARRCSGTGGDIIKPGRAPYDYAPLPPGAGLGKTDVHNGSRGGRFARALLVIFGSQERKPCSLGAARRMLMALLMTSTGIGEGWRCSGIKLVESPYLIELVAHPPLALLVGQERIELGRASSTGCILDRLFLSADGQSVLAGHRLLTIHLYPETF